MSLTTIDLDQLATVHGGETSDSNFNLGLTVPTEQGPANLGLQADQKLTNYRVCTAPFQPGLRTATTNYARNPTPENASAVSNISSAMAATCGLPPAPSTGAGQ